jgi:3-hydroxybutyryl-CoA dehydrogenase
MNPTESILVVGAGVMGRGIAQTFAQCGFKVFLADLKESILADALRFVQDFLKEGVKRGKISKEEADGVTSRIQVTTDMAAAAAHVGFVVEAVIEVQEVKTEIFRKLNVWCAPQVIFATNTSQISITELGRTSGRPDRFIGMHWFNPPQLMRLIEIPRGIETSQDTVNAMVQLAGWLGKAPVVCQDSPGFVVNRILNVWYNEGMRMADEGMATVEEIDRAIREGGGFKMGPMQLRDLVGLDVGLQVTESLYRRLGLEKFRPPECIRKRVEAGHLGRKSGKGFYDYGGVQN